MFDQDRYARLYLLGPQTHNELASDLWFGDLSWDEAVIIYGIEGREDAIRAQLESLPTIVPHHGQIDGITQCEDCGEWHPSPTVVGGICPECHEFYQLIPVSISFI